MSDSVRFLPDEGEEINAGDAGGTETMQLPGSSDEVGQKLFT